MVLGNSLRILQNAFDMERRVVVTGMGVISPVGNNLTDFWSSITAGKCGIGLIERFPTDNLLVKIAGEVKGFNPGDYGIDPPTARKNDRYALFALAAANQAMTASGLNKENIAPERLGVYIGSGIGGHGYLCIGDHQTGTGGSQVGIPTLHSDDDLQYRIRQHSYPI
jgi:3-oxoacyl-(acyl-carrier-protein) synthase